jgi:hypothetical protein
MQLRYLAALQDIAGDKASTLVFPIPIDLLQSLLPSRGGATTGET